MKLPALKIGNLVASIPIIQGGMAIRLSTARLAAAVAREGGIGLIAASGMAFDELRREIRLARRLTENKGIIGINAMVAAREFLGLLHTAISEGIDLIVAGAGFSRDMFSLGKKSDTPIVPIVSTAKLAKISQSLGAAAVVLEGKEAGGHLGTDLSMREILPEVKESVDIPVIAAGGVITGQDIVDTIKLGADGVQMGSRFAASCEANGAPALKEFYLKVKHEDVVLIDSPVGYPGRAVKNPFALKALSGNAPKPVICDSCLKSCTRSFCIIKALTRAQQGDVDTGLVFTGERMGEIKEILPVKEIFFRLLREVETIIV
ncbi:MAG: nitronate monooxygenase [Acidaminococcales bacterium]|nr:nitronate monooxygenase [Acidaminococcales bacterium]